MTIPYTGTGVIVDPKGTRFRHQKGLSGDHLISFLMQLGCMRIFSGSRDPDVKHQKRPNIFTEIIEITKITETRANKRSIFLFLAVKTI